MNLLKAIFWFLFDSYLKVLALGFSSPALDHLKLCSEASPQCSIISSLPSSSHPSLQSSDFMASSSGFSQLQAASLNGSETDHWTQSQQTFARATSLSHTICVIFANSLNSSVWLEMIIFALRISVSFYKWKMWPWHDVTYSNNDLLCTPGSRRTREDLETEASLGISLWTILAFPYFPPEA